jgi:transcriptional regulator of acetoin/glycerol metabolism
MDDRSATEMTLADLGDRLPASDTQAQRPVIAESWRRSRSAGVDRDAPGRVYREFDPHAPLARAARRFADSATDKLDDLDTWIAVTDERGVVTFDWTSTRGFARTVEWANVGAGSLLDEASAGTNAIGTALATRRSVVVRGTEHYHRGWAELVCIAHPILDATTGAVRGILNVTSPLAEHRHLRITLEAFVGAVRLMLTTPSAPAPSSRAHPHARPHRPLSPLEQAECDVIAGVLRECRGNKTEAAERLQMARGTLYERIRRYGIAEG